MHSGQRTAIIYNFTHISLKCFPKLDQSDSLLQHSVDQPNLLYTCITLQQK